MAPSPPSTPGSFSIATVTTLTPQQAAAINTRDVSVALSAGAGCGKTFVLTRRFLSHLEPERGASELGSLVAITYTERAAREMRDRIRVECLNRLRDCAPEEVPHWLGVVRELHGARINTIHAFCASLLRAHAVEAHLDPQFGLLDEATMTTFLASAVDEEMFELLAKQDDDCMEFVLEYGLDKSRALVQMLVERRFRIDFEQWRSRSAAEVAEGWKTFWRTEGIPRLVRELVESDATRGLLALLEQHDCSHPVMRERCHFLLAELPRLHQSADPRAMLDQITENARVQGGGTKAHWLDAEVFEQVKEGLKGLRDELKKLRESFDFDTSHTATAAAHGLRGLRITQLAGARYDARKREAGLLDFDDLLLLTRNLLRDQPDVLRRSAGGISLLMVDEFQDTDPVQAEIVRNLCGAELLKGKLFLVGDAKQSIYRFRRAEPAVFHELRNEIPAKGRLPLSTNFRSQPAILHFVNALFDGALGSEYEPLVPHVKQTSPEPAIEFLFSASDGEDDDANDRSAAARRTREAEWIARRLQQMLHDGVPRVRDHGALRCVEPRDIVILFRAMSDVRYYEQALRDIHTDYYVVGGQAFYAQQEIFDLVNLCQHLDDVDDEISLIGVLRSPFFSLSDDALFALSRQGPTLYEALQATPAAHLTEVEQRQIAHAGRVLVELRQNKDRLTIAQLLNLALTRTGYDAALLAEFLGVRKLANLRKLIEMAQQFDKPGLFTLSDFVERLRNAVTDETKESLAATHPESSNVIRLMSIHQSKGLEFPVVVVADMDRKGNDRPPEAIFDPQLGPLLSLGEKFGEKRDNLGLRLFKLQERDEAQAETIRLLYVATTRAADYLILSASLAKAGQVKHPWMKLLSERFDLNTGFPAVHPLTGEPRIPERSRAHIPKILVHQAAPEKVPVPHQAETQRVSPRQFRDIIDDAAPGPLPVTLNPVSPDLRSVPRWTVSQLEAAEAAAAQGALAAFPLVVNRTASETRDATRSPGTKLSLEQAGVLGDIVHAVLERLDFREPGDLDGAIRSFRGATDSELPEGMQQAARACIENLLASPLAAELAASRRCFRELEFLLRTPRPANADQPGTIVGTIDCLYESAAGEWVLVDYKTGSAPHAPSGMGAYELQLGVYALAAKQLLGRLPDRIELVYLRPGLERLSFQPTDEFVESITGRVDRAGALLAAEAFV